MKKLVSLVLLCLSITAFAQRYHVNKHLVDLSCEGTNGLKLELAQDSDIVNTELGRFTKQYETNRIVFHYGNERKSLTRIALGVVGNRSAYVYDIYLNGMPATRNKSVKMSGVIGRTLHTVIMTPIGAPVPWPVGFRPSTKLECTLTVN